MAQGDLLPTNDTTQGPMAADSHVTLTFEKFSSFVEEYRPKISLGGMFLATEDLKPVGTTVACDFKLTDGFRLCQALGEVVWIRRTPSAEQPAGMGLRFQAIDDKGRELVLKILEEQVKTGGEPFEVENTPADVESAPAPTNFSPDPSDTMSRPAWPISSPDDDPASTHSRSAVAAEAPVAGSTESLGEAPWGESPPDLPAEVLGEEDALGASLPSPEADSFSLDDNPFEVNTESPSFETGPSFGSDTASELSFDPAPDAGADLVAEPLDPAPTPVLDFGGTDDDLSVSPEPEPLSLESPSLEPPAAIDFGFSPESSGDLSLESDALPEFGAEALPTTGDSAPLDQPAAPEMGMPVLKEEASGAWDLEPLADDDPFAKTAPMSVNSSPDSFDAPGDSLGDGLPDDFGLPTAPDDLPLSDPPMGSAPMGSAPMESAMGSPGLDESVLNASLDESPVTDTGFLDTQADFADDPDEWDGDDEWDDADEGGGRFANLKFALQESLGRIAAVVLLLVVVGAGWFFKDTLMGLVGLGADESPPPRSAPVDRPAPVNNPADAGTTTDAVPQDPVPTTQDSTDTDSANDPEVVVAETPQGTEPTPIAAEVTPPPPALPAPPPPAPAPPPAQPITPPTTATPPTATPPPQRPAPTRGSAASLQDLSFQQTAAGTEIVIQFDGEMSFNRIEHNELAYDGLKQQVVLHGIKAPYRSTVDVGTLELDRIRTGFHGDRLNLVFDLSSELMTVTDIKAFGSRLELTVRRR